MINKKECRFKRVVEKKKIEEAIQDFLLDCEVRSLSKWTIDFYKRTLKPFVFFGKQNSVEYVNDITKEMVNKYIAHLKDSIENTTTINTYLRGLRTFLNFLKKEEFLENEIEINMLKEEEKIKETYSDEDIKKLLKKPDLKKCSFAEYRNWVLVNYLLETGNRLSSVINIKVSDVDLENGIVTIKHSKNKSHYFSPISNTMCKILREYIATWNLKEDDYLFPSQSGAQMTKNTIEKAIRDYNKKRGVKLTSIHAFRHTFAKNYIKTNGNPFKLKQLLGHKTLEITNRYVRLYSEDLKKDFEEHSIIEKFYKGSKRISKIKTNQNK
ncbi:tyrosine-type recombinase/integrase [Caldicellulosiruptor acetigenus]|uniref:Integrase family protein n=1 Tax=Caldicellulosiruptor acetigenus 6A TaxID=632516 RepID=G2PX17_9FIRM|nr:tyrosine-type recombinase/integrase [Caldicellulosiruptor acetigenus]AEM72972.1 integrase family protein [Caldicellulosiruptor acetigenus 6A]